jgi:hypothetical protein
LDGLSENIFIFGMVSWVAIRSWVAWRLDYNWRKYRDYLSSPEGKQRRTEEVQAAVAEIVADARRLGSHTERVIPVGSATFSAAAVMTEARRLAKNLAKENRGVKVSEVEASQIAEIARVLV